MRSSLLIMWNTHQPLLITCADQHCPTMLQWEGKFGVTYDRITLY